MSSVNFHSWYWMKCHWTQKDKLCINILRDCWKLIIEIPKQKEACATLDDTLSILKSKFLDLPIDRHVELFNTTVKPSIWIWNAELRKYRLHRKNPAEVLTYSLGLKSSNPNCLIHVYGETGIKPLSVDIESKIISYWSNLVTRRPIPKCHKLAYTYVILISSCIGCQDISSCRLQWIECVKSILHKCGVYNVWNNHEFPNHK